MVDPIFCGKCGGPMTHRDERRRLACDVCGSYSVTSAHDLSSQLSSALSRASDAEARAEQAERERDEMGAELAALKARRCETCNVYCPRSKGGTGSQECRHPWHTESWLDRRTAPDWHCADWTPKGGEP